METVPTFQSNGPMTVSDLSLEAMSAEGSSPSTDGFETPMTMTAFLEASAGIWMIRRVVHHQDHQDDEDGDSNLIVEPFGPNDNSVAAICAALGVDPSRGCGGARFWWESNLKLSDRSEDRAAALVNVVNPEDSAKGFLVRDKGYVEKQAVLSSYCFAEDGVLTITTRYDTSVGIERCWFVTDQLRMRVSSVQNLDGVTMTTYCTERRCPSDADILALARHTAEREI